MAEARDPRPTSRDREFEFYPQMEGEKTKCENFLANYMKGDEYPYARQLQEISTRERKL
jgi:hypothetical protein